MITRQKVQGVLRKAGFTKAGKLDGYEAFRIENYRPHGFLVVVRRNAPDIFVHHGGVLGLMYPRMNESYFAALTAAGIPCRLSESGGYVIVPKEAATDA